MTPPRRNSRPLMSHIPHYSLIFLRALFTPLIIFFAVVGNSLLVLCAMAFYWFEQAANPHVSGIFDAVYWAFTTVSTVGYGDITPITFEGKCIGIFLMITGVTLFVGFTALLVSSILSLTSEEFAREERLTQREFEQILLELRDLSKRIDKLERH